MTTPSGTNQGPGFWNELYWFLLLGLGASILALNYLLPQAEETLALLEKESDLDRQIERTELDILRYEKGVEAVERDPYYRANVYRDRMRILRENEERRSLPAATD